MSQMRGQTMDGAGTGSARLELAMAAAGRERANRPRVLVVLALVLLAATLIYAITGLSARASAQARVARAVRNATEIRTLVAEYQASSSVSSAARFVPDPLYAAKLERLAEGSGLILTGTVSSNDAPTTTPVPGLVKKTHRVEANNADPAVILAWLLTTQDAAQYPGLEISNLLLSPAGSGGAEAQFEGGWRMVVDFVRWERKGG